MATSLCLIASREREDFFTYVNVALWPITFTIAAWRGHPPDLDNDDYSD